MKNDDSVLIDKCIAICEERLDLENKHLIKAVTLLGMIERQISMMDDDERRERFLVLGAKKVIFNRLYAAGYRSIGRGYWVNIEKCQNEDYLLAVVREEELDRDQKENMLKQYREIMEKKRDGSYEFSFDENNFPHIVEGMTEEDFIRALELDAV